MNYGLERAIQTVEEYVIGGAKVPYIYYNEDGDWEKWLPKYEPQAENFETYGCTCWGSLNQLEILHKFLYKKEPNYAERFNYLLIGLDGTKGTDPQKAHESIRKDGVVDQDRCPITRTLAGFLDRSILTGSLLAKGQYWAGQYTYLHEWLWATPPQNWKEILKDALKTSPLAVSVSAWTYQNGAYISAFPNNHYCVLYKIDDEGYMYVFDSYDHSKKKLAPTHAIGRAKRIWLNRGTRAYLKKHRTLLESILYRLMNSRSFVDVCRDALGTDVTPADVISDDVACAEVVTTLMKKYYKTTPIIAGTWTLSKWFENPDNGFVPTSNPRAGDIVISPTGSGYAGTRGHVGVYLGDELIASNTSFGVNAGKFMANYTRDTWYERYHVKQGMPVIYYTHL